MTDQSRQEAPKVFISHSSGDKGRFVLEFARRLRTAGVDAWLDQWEMNPGDSLVDKVFEQGLKDCSAMIVVLSESSVRSRWVREELNTGIVKRIEEKTKLIPVRLDAVDVPESLRSTVWQDIPDLTNYEHQFERIVNAIYGQYDKPPLGAKPLRVQTSGSPISGLSKIDSRVFEAACRTSIADDSDLVVREPLRRTLSELGVSDDQVSESLEVLSHERWIEPIRSGQFIPAFKISAVGLEQFLRHHLPDFDSLLDRVCVLLATESADDTAAVSKQIGQPDHVSAFFLDLIERQGLIKMAHLGTASMRKVYEISPALRRKLQG